jgi:hypothetical protein
MLNAFICEESSLISLYFYKNAKYVLSKKKRIKLSFSSPFGAHGLKHAEQTNSHTITYPSGYRLNKSCSTFYSANLKPETE